MQQSSLQSMHAAVRTHLQAGRTGKAMTLLQQIVQDYPREHRAPFMLGALAYQTGDLRVAIDWLQKSIVLDPEPAEPYFLCGLIFQRQGRLPEAINAYRKFLARKPGDAKALNNLGRAVLDTGDFGQAIAILNDAVKADPANAGACNNLGDARRIEGNLTSAIEQYRKAIATDPNCVEAHGNLGVALAQQGHTAEGVKSIQRAIALNPAMFNPRFNLAKILREAGYLEDALEQCKAALQLRPGSAEAHNLLGNVLGMTGHISQCIAAQRRAVELKPDFAAAHSNLLLSLHYLPGIAPADLFAAHQQWASQQMRAITPGKPDSSKDRSGRRLRVGYVSPNFNSHSVACFFEPVLAAHDRNALEIFAYSDVQTDDGTTTRLKNLAEHWREIAGKSDVEVSALIQQDNIDVLVDLAGHTSGNRLLLFARRPAAVQITWLGYPDTTGLKTMDYRVTDAIADPPGESDRLHTEKLIRITGGAWAYTAADSPETGPLPALSNGYITFGSFNNLPKVTPKVLEVWAQILHRTAGSRLILKASGLASATGRDYVSRHLEQFGISRDRVELLGWVPGTQSHLQLYNRVDIALDTFPYNGTTTTCEAMWLGVPVITVVGSTHVARVGAALLTHANSPQWITSDLPGYVEAATQLAADLPALGKLRADLRNQLRHSPLGDARRLATGLEALYARSVNASDS